MSGPDLVRYRQGRDTLPVFSPDYRSRFIARSDGCPHGQAVGIEFFLVIEAVAVLVMDVLPVTEQGVGDQIYDATTDRRPR
jgi:hypothetical protein